jgi:hypothetical protein
LSPVPIRDKVCGVGAKSLKTLECGREKLIYLIFLKIFLMSIDISVMLCCVHENAR